MDVGRSSSRQSHRPSVHRASCCGSFEDTFGRRDARPSLHIVLFVVNEGQCVDRLLEGFLQVPVPRSLCKLDSLQKCHARPKISNLGSCLNGRRLIFFGWCAFNICLIALVAVDLLDVGL